MYHKSNSSTFCIKSGDVGFTDRQKNIFDQLAAAEKMKNEKLGQNITEPDTQDVDPNLFVTGNDIRSTRRTLKRHRSEMRQFRGQESIFKRPDEPPRFQPKSKAIPDYHKNPHKWVKYSLGDVSQDDMSNHSNTSAALSFLKEIAARKEGQNSSPMDVDDVVTKKVEFKRPRPSSSRIMSSKQLVKFEPSGNSEKPSFRSTKLIMPEYVVGQSNIKKKDRKKISPFSKAERAKEIALKHLMDDDDEEETVEEDEKVGEND